MINKRRFDTVLSRLLLLAGLPLLLISIVALYGFRTIITPSILRSSLTSLNQDNAIKVSLVENWIEEHLSKARYVGTMMCTQDWDVDTMLTESRRMADSFHDVLAIVIADSDGNVAVDSIHGTGGSIRDRQYFQDAIAGRPVVTELLQTRNTGTAVLLFVVPIKSGNTGEARGVAMVVNNPVTLYQALQSNPSGRTYRSFIVNTGGTIVTGPDLGSDFVRIDHTEGEIASSYTNYAGEDVYGVTSTVPGTPWILVTESDVSDVTSGFRAYNHLLTVIVLIGLVIASVLAVLLALSIQRPVQGLFLFSQKLTDRSRIPSDVPFPIYAPTELRRLHTTLHEMTMTIDSSTRDLEEANTLLANTQEIAHLGSWVFTPPARVLTCSDEIYRILGLSDRSVPLDIPTVIRIIDREDRLGYIHGIIQSIREGAPGFEQEHRIRRADTGETRIVLQRCIHYRNSDGRLVQTIGMTHDITEQAMTQQSLRDAVEEKTVLLQEVNHRVRNNLSIVLGILNLQKTNLPESSRAYNAITTAGNRVAAIALVHDLLLDDESLSSINLADYIPNLLMNIQESQNDPSILLGHTVESIAVEISLAVPLGMILNELVLNSYKHAFNGGSGTISVELKRNPGSAIRLDVRDNGTGFNGNSGNPRLGLHLITQLVEQLKGSIVYADGAGTHAVLLL